MSAESCSWYLITMGAGSVHDDHILSGNGVTILSKRGHVPQDSHLLGDSNYPSKPWLLAPYRVGHRRDALPCPIVAHFTHYCDHDLVMRNAIKFKGTTCVLLRTCTLYNP